MSKRILILSSVALAVILYWLRMCNEVAVQYAHIIILWIGAIRNSQLTSKYKVKHIFEGIPYFL
jgi:hypothetical protein